MNAVKNSIESILWCDMVKRFRVNPRATCTLMLAALERFRTWSVEDEARAVDTLKTAGIDPDELKAHFVREALHEIKEGL